MAFSHRMNCFARSTMEEEYKNLRKQSIKRTRKRRKSQTCKVYQIKFDYSHLSKEKKEYLSRIFLEAKWLYNHILSLEDVFSFDTKVKTVVVLNRNKEREERELQFLSSQVRQGIYIRLLRNIKALSRLKKNGNIGIKG